MKHNFFIILLTSFLITSCQMKDPKSDRTQEQKQEQDSLLSSLSEPRLYGDVHEQKAKEDSIFRLIELFRTNNKEEIAKKISYPLDRLYPVPPIKDEKEFMDRFSEVFDKELIDRIVNSKIEQWTEVGWRGIMLDQGVIWMLNSDGVITSIGHRTVKEKELERTLIANDKEFLHSSLRSFVSPVCKLKTDKHLIRIDEIEGQNYRYASWKIGQKESSRPDLIIEQGNIDYMGNGGNHRYLFDNKGYQYVVDVIVLGTPDDPPYKLEVLKEGRIISIQDGHPEFPIVSEVVDQDN